MALLVFVSTLSVSVEKHYCGDHLVAIAVFSEAENCGMETAEQDVELGIQGTVLTKKNCCKDVIDLYEGQDKLSLKKTQSLNTDQKVFILSFATVFSGLYHTSPQLQRPFEDYSPPLPVKDIQVLNEVFLI